MLQKTLLALVFAGAIFMTGVHAQPKQAAAQQEPPPPPAPAQVPGRYVLTTGKAGANDVMVLIDSATGSSWYLSAQNNTFVWVGINYQK